MSDASGDFNDSVLDGTPVSTLHRVWAMVEDGFVVGVKRSADLINHPFGDAAKDKRILDVTGVPCAIGYMADDRGNVAPSHGRLMPLVPQEAAYHDRSNPAAPPVAVTAAALATGEPHPLELGDKDPGATDRAGLSTEKGAVAKTVATDVARAKATAQENSAERT